MQPGRPQLTGSRIADVTERDADLDVQLGHAAHDVEHFLKLLRTLTHPGPRRAHAETRGADFLRLPGFGDHFVARQQVLGLDAGFVAGTLGAV